MDSRSPHGVSRRTLVKLGAIALAAPPIIRARGETPVKIGYIDPLTGTLAALAQTEVQGAKYAVAEINQKGGILGRPVQLLVEDSANDVGTGVEKALKLINRDHVDMICADVNSAIAYAVSQVTSEHKVFHIVPGGHTDPITGSSCKWNVFRICNTTSMDANAISGELIKRFGKRWYFITPDYAYGHTLQDAFVKNLKNAGGEYKGDMLPIANTDFSASLIKAKAYKPNVLLNNMGGLAQIDCMKQFVQFGMTKDMALGGALFEVESVLSVPAEAQTGWWDMEWWWNQPGVPHVAEFNAGIKKAYNVPAATARHWFGYVAVHTLRLAAEDAKSLEALKLAKATAGMTLPPEVALQNGKVTYREGDHELMAGIFVGQVHTPQGDPGNVFSVSTVVPGEQAAGPAADTGCKMTWPTA
ncbi:MAG: ABC transporter substrate-binding protein [Acetobacteraceae bacterium]